MILNASSSPKIRNWILECATATKRHHLKRAGPFQTINNEIKTALHAIAKPERSTKFLDAHEKCEKMTPDVTYQDEK